MFVVFVFAVAHNSAAKLQKIIWNARKKYQEICGKGGKKSLTTLE